MLFISCIDILLGKVSKSSGVRTVGSGSVIWEKAWVAVGLLRSLIDVI